MRKFLVIQVVMLLTLSNVFGQIGVNNLSPAATMDVKALYPNGSHNGTDGLLIPRIDRQRAQVMQNVENSTLIYIEDVNTGAQSGQAQYIDMPGFYYYDSDVQAWLRVQSLGPTPTHGLINYTTNNEIWGYGLGISGGTTNGSPLYKNNGMPYQFLLPANTINKDGSYITFFFRTYRSAGLGVWHTAIRVSLDGGATWSTSANQTARWTQSTLADEMVMTGKIFWNDDALTLITDAGDYMKLDVTNNVPLTFGLFSGTDDLITRITVDYARFDIIN